MLTDQYLPEDNYVDVMGDDVPDYSRGHYTTYPAKSNSVERKFEADKAYALGTIDQPLLLTRSGCNPELNSVGRHGRPVESTGPIRGSGTYKSSKVIPATYIESMVGGIASGDNFQLLMFVMLIALVIYQFVILRGVAAKLSKMSKRVKNMEKPDRE
jgi:hypothetical protein